ncbi:MAG: hypothetical protein NC548_34435 [Lachnospiraceae bacterium]|nr:hypothetical protein [Lachnospiraceae bacterium]
MRDTEKVVEIPAELAAKALVDIAYEKKLINQETYLKIQRKYGGLYDVYDDAGAE